MFENIPGLTPRQVLGDYHGIELDYVWNIPISTWHAADYTLSSQVLLSPLHEPRLTARMQMGCYWSAVASAGDPNSNDCSNTVYWPPNTGTSGDFNLFLGAPLETGGGLDQAQCDFWDTIGYNI